MSTNDQFLFGLQANQEIQLKLLQGESCHSVFPPAPIPMYSAMQVNDVHSECLPLGLEENGLPLLLDLYDPTGGPLLVAGDGSSGKTAFLQSLAKASDLKDPGEIQFGVLTPFPEEWKVEETYPNCMGIWPAYHPTAGSFLRQLISWAEVLGESRQAVLILLDGLDLLSSCGFQFQHTLRWLLKYGSERHIWPIVTVNPGKLNHLASWLDYFQTRVVGQVKRSETAHALVNDPEIDLAALLPGCQFCLSRPAGWVKFWLSQVNLMERGVS